MRVYYRLIDDIDVILRNIRAWLEVDGIATYVKSQIITIRKGEDSVDFELSS